MLSTDQPSTAMRDTENYTASFVIRNPTTYVYQPSPGTVIVSPLSETLPCSDCTYGFPSKT
nr:MAG TPA: hypothetical protein [Caudoviricetes sp.]